MAKSTTIEWALGRWADRTGLTYVPICKGIGTVEIDRYGRKAGTHLYNASFGRSVYKAEEGDTGITYLMYDDDTAIDVPVIRVTETEG